MDTNAAALQLIGEVQAQLIPNALQYAIALSPILLAVIMFWIMKDVWMRYVNAYFYNSIKYCVLELKLPKDTFKSPAAMEMVFTGIHNTADGSAYSRFWKGEYRPYYSMELVSIEGQVKFMVWLEERRKASIVAPLYAQFPGIEIIEREDYAKSVHYDPKTMKVWAADWKLTKPDPYPIKTYIDYGLDRDPKEEFKIDPLVPFIEFLGTVGPNQQIWVQFIVRAHKKDSVKGGHLFKLEDSYQVQAKKEIDKLLSRDPKTKVSGWDPETKTSSFVTLSKGEQEAATAIERSLSKPAFDVGIRAIYVAKKEFFNTPFGIGGLISSFKQFSSETLNGIKQDSDTYIAKFDGLPWEDYKNFRRNRESRMALAAYKRRSFFYPPFTGKSMVLTSEELATLYHFPGSVAATPTLDRVPSKKAEAPSNLPT